MSLPLDFETTQETLKTVISILTPLAEDQRRFVLHSTAAWFNNVEEISAPTHQEKTNGLQPSSLQDFVFSKKTKNDAEAVAVLAYYLEEYRDQKSFKTSDLDSLNKEAGIGQKFGNITKTVNNAAQRSLFFDQAGNGSKRLTPLGRMVVKALPNEEEVKRIIEEYKPREKRKSSKKDKT